MSVRLFAGLILITQICYCLAERLHDSVSAPVTLWLLEPDHERYLFVDTENNNVHMTMPIIGGDEFGVDNTCQAAIEIKLFIKGQRETKRKPQINSGLVRLKTYRNVLDFDIWFLEKLVVERRNDTLISNLMDAKVTRLKQVDAYIEVLTLTIDHWIREKQIVGVYPKFPAELFEAIKLSKNLFSMLLAPGPKETDTTMRLPAPSFGAALNEERTKSKFAEQLIKFLDAERASWGAEIRTAAEDLENYVFKGTFKRDTNATQKLFEEMQTRIEDYFKSRGKMKSTFTYPTLQGLVDQIIDWPNMDKAYYYTQIEEFKYGIERDFPNKASFLTLELVSFFPPLPARSKPVMASVLIQAFLGLVNLHYKAYLCNEHSFAKTPKVCGNLWEFLEVPQDGALEAKNLTEDVWLQTRFEQIYDALKAPDPEDALIQWVGEKYFRDALPDHVKGQLKRRFENFWSTVWHAQPPAPHFDEWLFLFKDLKGPAFTHQGAISIDFAAFFVRYAESLVEPPVQIAGETMKALRDLAQSFRNRASSGSGLPYKNSGIRQSVTVSQAWLRQVAANATEPTREMLKAAGMPPALL